MSLQPDTDQRLAKTSGRLTANGVKLLVLAVIIDVVGVVLIVADISFVAGLFCLGLSAAPTLAAFGLIGSGAVGRREAQHKDWA